MFCGIDPGTTNLGVSFYCPENDEFDLNLYNLKIRDGKIYNITPRHYPMVIERMYEHFSPMWDYTKVIAIEHQAISKPFIKKLVPVLFDFFVEKGHKVFIIDPQLVRRWLGSSGTSYEGRKMKSWELFQDRLFPEDIEIIDKWLTIRQKKFPNGRLRPKKMHVDPIEAAQLAEYCATHESTLKSVPQTPSKKKAPLIPRKVPQPRVKYTTRMPQYQNHPITKVRRDPK